MLEGGRHLLLYRDAPSQTLSFPDDLIPQTTARPPHWSPALETRVIVRPERVLGSFFLTDAAPSPAFLYIPDSARMATMSSYTIPFFWRLHSLGQPGAVWPCEGQVGKAGHLSPFFKSFLDSAHLFFFALEPPAVFPTIFALVL